MSIKLSTAAFGLAGFAVASFGPFIDIVAGSLIGAPQQNASQKVQAVSPAQYPAIAFLDVNKPILKTLVSQNKASTGRQSTAAQSGQEVAAINKTDDKNELEEQAPAPEPSKPAEVKVKVELGDSLSSIAAAHQTSYARLFSANPAIAQPDLINPGDEIRIPAVDEQLAERPLPAPKPVEVAKPAASTPAASGKPAVVPANAASGDVWDRLARCESGGNWAINTGNGYYGGLQFTLGTWRGVGGAGYPHQASREEQIARGQMLQARSGWGQWPACTSKLGLR